MSRFGVPPALELLFAERWSVPLAARTIGVPVGHLRHVMRGNTRPSEATKTGLSKLLGVPVEKLFTEAVLSKAYDPTRNPWKASS